MNDANPYAPPEAEAAPTAALDDDPPRLQPLRWLGGAFVTYLGGYGVAMLGAPQVVVALVFGAAALAALFGAVLGFAQVLRAIFRQRSGRNALLGLAALVGNGFMFMVGAFTALFASGSFVRGRQLRRRGKVLLPPIEPGSAWAAPSPHVEVDEGAREALAAQWRENGRTEHASVAAFARLTLDLMALGAPPALVAASNRDALDEIRHTEMCFALARSLDGREESPGAFPEAQRARTRPAARTLALAELAVDSLVDGALHEGLSARVVAKLAKRAEEPAIRGMLKQIAADEGRHAAHGWDVVVWCLQEGGAPVAEALRGALRVLPEKVQSPLPEAAREGAWERYGIHGHGLEAEEFAKARADLVRRVNALVGEARQAARSDPGRPAKPAPLSSRPWSLP